MVKKEYNGYTRLKRKGKDIQNGSIILVCRWGATMTLYDFYEVMKETDKTLLTIKLEKESVGSDGNGLSKVSPKWPLRPEKDRDQKPVMVRVYKQKEGEYFNRASGYYKKYTIWDGQPKTEDYND